MNKHVIGKFLVVCFLASIIATMISGCGKEEEYKEESKIYKIGAIFAVTGPVAILGAPEKNAAEMLEKQINEAGGINGKEVDIVVYDTEGLKQTARINIDKLVNVDKVCAIVGPTRSVVSLDILDLIQDAQIPLISCAADTRIVEPVAKRKWVFKTPPSDALMVQAITDYLQKQNIDKVAIITVENRLGDSGKTAMEEQFPAAGIEIVAKQRFNDGDTDTLVQLTRIKTTDAGAVICWSAAGAGAIVSKNMKADLKMEMPLIMSHNVASQKYIDAAGEAANGVALPVSKLLIASDLPDSDPQKEAILKYMADYKAAYNEEADAFGGYAWDAINLLFKAVEKSGGNKAKIKEELENIENFVGVTGVFNFSAEDHNGLTKQGVIMVKIVDGKFTLTK